jgi:threonine dehydrogenase-like Zn-dependent dehydrogenase
MKAVVLQSGNKFGLEDVPKPQLQKNHDVIVKVTTAAICGSDIHAKHGVIPGYGPGAAMGHEFAGVIDGVGSDVINFKPGDRVAAAPITWCGVCPNCKRGDGPHCKFGGVFGGGAIFGPRLGGAQAEYIRVPYADNCLIHTPDNVPDEQAVLVGDIFATGYKAAKEAHIQTGDTVVVYGCGPVGMGAVISALQFGPKKVYAVELLDNRLAIAEGYGAETINGNDTDVVEKVRAITGGEGLDVAIEAVGELVTFTNALRSVRNDGMVSVVGLFPGPVEFPLHEMGFYGVRLVMGLGAPSYMSQLMALVESGRVDLKGLVTQVFPLDKAVEAFDLVEFHKDQCLKVLLKP